jgi:replicative DNA helicase
MSISEFVDSDCRVLYVSRTLTEFELTTHLLAGVTGADVDRVAVGRMIDVEWDRLVNSLKRLFTLDFSIVQTPLLSLAQLNDWMKHAASETKAKLFIILDDERLMGAEPERSANGLTRLAKKYDAAI